MIYFNNFYTYSPYRYTMTTIIEKHYENGTLKLRKTLVDGELHGSYKKWYPSGQLMTHSNYFHDDLDGLYRSWYEDGSLLKHCYFRDGEQEGLDRVWCSDGKLRYENNYVDGKAISWKEWDENEELIIDGKVEFMDYD